MYSDEDLNLAIKKGTFSASAVKAFRQQIAETKALTAADEEHFKLIGGFNDIFIVIACGLLLFSSFSVLEAVNVSLAYFIFGTLSWVLAEFFVLKRKMALPAIMLLIGFIGSVVGLSHHWLALSTASGANLAAMLGGLAALVHWRRFSVPITVAVGTAAVVALLLSSLMTVLPEGHTALSPVLLICGLLVFAFAMFWDSADTTRVNYRSDVAFWLHLLAAPLIIHPVFINLDIANGNENLWGLALVILLYFLITFVSVCLDRRVLMLSSLGYVLYALSSLIDRYGIIGSNFALTGILLGSGLVLLSVYWHRIRVHFVSYLPIAWQGYIPKAKLI